MDKILAFAFIFLDFVKFEPLFALNIGRLSDYNAVYNYIINNQVCQYLFQKNF